MNAGDTYRYTLQPIYHDVDRSLKCHLRPRPVPDVLYQMWFYITVPGTGFETDRLYAPVSPRDVRSADGGRVSRRRVEFVTVDSEPTSGTCDDRRELVLTARRQTNDDDTWRYTTTPVTSATVKTTPLRLKTTPVTSAGAGGRSSRFQLQRVAENVAVTATSFVRPFAHSTSTWVTGDDDQTATRCIQSSYSLCLWNSQ